MLWMKIKTAVIITIVVIVGGGGTAIAVKAAHGSTTTASAGSDAALQGTWVGQETGRRQGEIHLTVSGNSMKFQGASAEEWYEATLTLKTDANPKQAVARVEKCPFQQYVGKTANFIYKIEGKTLTLAGTEPGSDDSPTGFEPSPDNRVRVFVLSKQ